MKWDNLTMSQKQALMKIYVNNGVTNLDEIVNHYNRFAEGGLKINRFDDGGNKNPISKRIVNRVHADGFYGGTDGVGSAIKQFIFNKKGDPEKRLNEIENYYINNEDYIHHTPYEVAKEELSPEEFIKFEQAIRLPMLQQHKDALNIYLGYPQIYNTMEESPYQNIVSKDNKTYQVNDLLSDGSFEDLIIPSYSDWKYKNENEFVKDLGKTAQLYEVPYLNHAGLSEGFDSKKGHYVSLFDTWDYNTKFQGKHGDNIGKYIGGEPFDLYHRYYLDEWMDIPEDKRGSYFLPEIVITPDKKKYGGKVNRFDEGGYKSQSDNTRVQMPRTDVEPIYYEPAAVAANAVSKQPQSGALTPVYPEFELLMGLRAAAIGAAKGVKAASKVSSKAPSKAVKINNKITADNLADITDEMWDDAYNAAIANNDLVEAQRLRDLHFKAKAPNTKVVDSNGNPVKTYHGNMTGDQHYRSQRLNPYSTTRSSRVSSGYFSSSSEKIADSYHITPDAKTHQVYLNYEDPLIIDAQGAHYSTVGTDRVVNKAFSQGKDGVIIKNVEDAGIGRISGPVVGEDRIADDFISTAGRAKSSDAVTKRVDIFTGEDEIIPLSERDNFLNPDIRYILAPAFMTGTGYGIYNTTNNTSTHKYGGKLKKNKK